MAKRTTEPAITDALRRMIRAQPFHKIDLKTTDGDTFHVFHPDFCMISPSGGTAIIYDRAGDGFSIVNLSQIVSVAPTRPKKGLIGGPGKK